MAPEVKNLLKRYEIKVFVILLLNVIRIWSDQMDVEQLEDITNEIVSLHKSTKNLMEIVFKFSPLLALLTHGWSRAYNSIYLIRVCDDLFIPDIYQCL